MSLIIRTVCETVVKTALGCSEWHPHISITSRAGSRPEGVWGGVGVGGWDVGAPVFPSSLFSSSQSDLCPCSVAPLYLRVIPDPCETESCPMGIAQLFVRIIFLKYFSSSGVQREFFSCLVCTPGLIMKCLEPRSNEFCPCSTLNLVWHQLKARGVICTVCPSQMHKHRHTST